MNSRVLVLETQNGARSRWKVIKCECGACYIGFTQIDNAVI